MAAMRRWKMFARLLNSKFYKKCTIEHAIIFTLTRLDLVRRNKQARVRILRQDVAALITMGLESHAFGRMKELIVEMNQVSNYDVIEQYCEYIARQLDDLEKQSECPREALEAVSTLIFAAAGYPDVPELCDLRHVFRKKYGASFEHFVSSEFVRKLQNESFTKEYKLLVMQDIVQEFALPFTIKAIEQKISGVPQNKKDPLKKGSFNGVEVEASGCNGHKVDKHAVLERKSKSIPEGRERRQKVQIKPDIHVVPDCVGQIGERSRKNYSDKLTEKKHINNDALPLDIKRRNGRAEIKKDEKKGGQSWRELMNAEELDLNGSKKQEVAVTKPLQRKSKKIVPLCTELKDTEKKDGGEKADGKGYRRSHKAGGADHNSGHADLGLKTLGLKKQGTEPASTLNSKIANKVPSYSKPYRGMSEKPGEEDNIGLYNQARHIGEFRQLMQDRQQMREKKAVNMRSLYVKPNTNMKSAAENPTIEAATGYMHSSEETGYRRDGLGDDDAPQPVSVRRQSTKPPANGSMYSEATNDEKMANQTPGGQTRGSNNRNGHHDDYERRKQSSRQNRSASGSGYEADEDETDYPIEFGNLLPRAPSSHQKHRSRKTHPREGGHDDMARMLYKLLRHYSKKGK